MDALKHNLRYQALRRRSLFLGLTALTASVASLLMFDILRANGMTLLESVSWILFSALFVWITGAVWVAVIGFVLRLRGRDPALIQDDGDGKEPPRGRTVLVMPIYNEDVERVGAGIDAVWGSLAAQAGRETFDFFILSDTRDAAIVAAEEDLWRALIARHRAAGRIFYRRREQNTGRKAGNIADFVRCWGAAYDYMVVLDADSIMTGRTLVRLARLMDSHPKVGIFQTLPLLAGRDTVFARMQQFAARLNSPMLSSGLAFWHLGESNYWGHNAIIRIRPFADFCCLPRLPGAEPLGGEVMSHDFVEAAFMRAAGYEVWFLPDLGGSWEEMPSNAIDFAARDRRWTQGNLQHMHILPVRGLHWVSRLHMFTGILAYITAPVWFAILVLGSVLAGIEALQEPHYFQPGSFFPQWPQFRPGEIAALLAMTAIVLFVPKFLGAVLAATDRRLRREFGGTGRMFASVGLELLFSMLAAPTMMVFHSMFVVQTLLGRRVGWSGQDRGDRALGFRETFARYKWHTALGLAWGAAILWVTPKFIWWMLPVLAGLVLAIPLTMLTSRADLGRRLREWRLFVTPEESSPPRELAAVRGSNAVRAAPEATPVPSATGVPDRAPLRMEPRPGIFARQGNGAAEQ